MKKILLFLFVMVFVFVISATFVVAQEESVSTLDTGIAVVEQMEITTQDLGIEDPGMLPTSRFYFLKDLNRTFKRVFTFNSVKKAELELDIANEQAAEIQRMEEITPERTDAIAKAVTNYQENVDKLKNRLDAMKETSQNPNVDKLMEKLTDRSIKHQQLFDELKQKFEDRLELKQQFGKMQDKINEAVAKIPEKFDNPEVFKERIKKAIEARPDGSFKELRSMEIVDRIMEKMPADRRDKLGEIKDDFMKKLEDRMGQMSEDQRKEFLRPEILEKLPGDPEVRMRIMEEMKTRVSSPDIQKEIIEAKEGILKERIEKGEIKKEAVEKLINETRDLIAKAESDLANAQSDLKQIAEKMLGISKARIAEAEKALGDNKIGEAFGHATAASAAARSALRPESFLNRPLYIDPTIRQAIPASAPAGILPSPQTAPTTGTTTITVKCGDGICDLIEKEKGFCAIDCK